MVIPILITIMHGKFHKNAIEKRLRECIT